MTLIVALAIAPVKQVWAVSNCGDTLATVNGVNVISNGGMEGTGNSCGGSTQNTVQTPTGTTVTTGYEWQCVEFVNRYYAQKGWISSHWSGNGSALKDNLPSGMTFMPNGSITSIVVGDVVTLNYSTFGHAGVVSAVNGNTITIANQNAGAGLWGTATYDPAAKTLTSEYSGYTTQGVIHAAANNPTWVPLAGDWDGNGTVTAGLYDPSTATFYLRNSNNSGGADITTTFGSGGNWIPVVGNWDGVGGDTIGVYDPSTARFHLSNYNTSPQDNYSPAFGNGGSWVPVAGNWDGYGGDTIGVYDPSTARFHLSNYNTSPQDNYSPAFGSGGNWIPVVGNWDGYGGDTIGVYDPSTARFHLSNYNTSPQDNYSVIYGSGGSWKPVVGDWDTNGTTTVGIYDHAGATFYLSNSNTSGVTATGFTYGNPN